MVMEPKEVASVLIFIFPSRSQFARSTDDGPALLTSDGFRIQGCDVFDLGPMSGFAIPRIAGYHAVIVQEMQVSFPWVFLA
jgi:hypothetical protein